MLRHFTQPFNPGILHRRIRIQSFGHRIRNNRMAFFFQQFDEPLLFGNQRINFGGFKIKEIGYYRLFFFWRNKNGHS